MHELAVMAHLLERVELHAARHNATKVVSINLVIGDRASIVDDSLLFAFDLLASGSVADGASLKIRRTPMRFICDACDANYQPTGFDFRCPACGAIGKATDDGSELMIESLEFQT